MGEPMRLRLDIAYDGTDFSGWAVQPGRRTVAGVLGEALATVFRTPVPLVVAGRTDAGVHATGQVAHIDVDPAALSGLAPRHLARRDAAGSVTDAAGSVTDAAGSVTDAAGSPADAHVGGSSVPDPTATAGLIGLRRRLAGLLPPDVRVVRAAPAPMGFDARFSALRRHYRYRIATTDWGAPPLRRADTLAWRRTLDVAAMQAAAEALLGLRDFAAYCKPRQGATTVRDLQVLAITGAPLSEGEPGSRAEGLEYAELSGMCGAGSRGGDDPAGAGPDPGALVCIHVTADAFCHSMVRSLVGALLAVGEGRWPVDRPAALLAAGRRTAEIAVAPAHGLTLVRVDYPADDALAERARTTRAVRGPTPPVR